MEDIGWAQNLAGLQHSPAEQGKPLRVVGIVPLGCTVERVAIEERRIIDKVKLHARVNAAIEHGTEAVLIIERHRDAGQHTLGRTAQPGLSILRQEDDQLMSERGQRLGQRANDVSQSTSFRKRNALGSGKGNSHQAPPESSEMRGLLLCIPTLNS